MVRKLWLCALACIIVAAAPAPQLARAADSNLDGLIARHAAANNVPEDLIRRVIKRESGGNPRLGQQRQLRADADQAGDRAFAWATRQRRRPARCRYQHDLCGEISRRRLSRCPRQHGLAVHYYAAGYYYAAKGRGLFNRDGSATNAFASVSRTTGDYIVSAVESSSLALNH